MTLPPPECKVYTPPQLADAMVGSIDPHDGDLWLDPCIGAGAFVAQLRKRGISKDRIVGIDIDPEAGIEDRAATTLRGVDFFKWCSSTKRRFTKIIANPPYVAISKLHPDLQESLRDFGGNKNSAFTLSSNYWCAFLSASMQVLEDSGSLSFVLPAAWDYALYATEVRQEVLNKFQCVSVHRSWNLDQIKDQLRG
jgi:adenine-specific DNA-methyltransferase